MPLQFRQPIERRSGLLLIAGLFVALGLNAPTWWRRAAAVYFPGTDSSAWLGALAEAGLITSFTILLLTLVGWCGVWAWRVCATAILLLSAVCSYYMTAFNVVIGYGIVQSVLTTDHDMSVEVVGVGLGLWTLVFGVLPAWLIVRRPAPPSLRCVLAGHCSRGRHMAIVLGALALLLLCSHALVGFGASLRQAATDAVTNLRGVAAHSYVPSNWIAGTAMWAGNALSQDDGKLRDPASQFSYVAGAPLDGVQVVMVVGESARSDNFGVLGYERSTTPSLAAQRNAVTLKAMSCDTSTKLSLACMFVRPEGISPGDGLAPDRILERDVFSVFRKLGFSIDLFAMQSEAGFYQRVRPDLYKIREVIAADPDNAERRLDDALLLPELEDSVARHPDGRHLTILHMKGSHFLYSQRYPRAFARWQPECMSVDGHCSKQELINAYDNSILYTDHLLGQMMARLADRKAVLFFTTDHGESIDEQRHFHATPRKLAPAEQRHVPVMVWASDALLADPAHAENFARLKARAASLGQSDVGHYQLFASLLGCLGVRSPDGGITARHNLCG